jgi:hypothetical protein
MNQVIYKLKFVDYPKYYYIGHHKKGSNRLQTHKYKSLTIGSHQYNKKLSIKMREFGITKQNFYKKVIYVKMCNTNEESVGKIEDYLIHCEDIYCLNMRRGDIDCIVNGTSYHKQKYKELPNKIVCKICDYKSKKINKRMWEAHYNSQKHMDNLK